MPGKSTKKSSTAAAPITICHLADIHLGYRRYNRLAKNGFNQREVDVSIAFREAVDRCIALKPSVTVIAGDLFHAVRPSNAILTFAFREVRRLCAETKAPLVLVAGNHETPRRADTGSPLRLLAEVPGVYVADTKVEQFSFADLGLAVTCVPHAALTNKESLALRSDDRFTYNMLVAHAQVDKRVISDFGGVDIDLRDLKPHEWDYIALGHVHSRHEVALNAVYSGSIEHTGANVWLGHLENKGFLSVELPSAKRTFHALTAPREVVVVSPIMCRGQDATEVMTHINEQVEKVAGGLEGKLVRIELLECTRELYRQLDHRTLRRYRGQALNFTIEVRTPAAVGIAASSAKTPRGSLTTELEKFCQSWTQDKVQSGEKDPSALWDTVKHYLRKVEEEDEARSA